MKHDDENRLSVDALKMRTAIERRLFAASGATVGPRRRRAMTIVIVVVASSLALLAALA